MREELDTILRLVAEGRLTPEEAGPIVDALTRSPASDAAQLGGSTAATGGGSADEARPGDGSRSGRHLRIRVTEHGRQVVNLRIPIGFVDTALQFVPGLAGDQSRRIREAVNAGATGPILDIEEPDGNGVLITVD